MGAYRNGEFRVVSNFFFFNSTQDLMDWLKAEDTGPKLVEAFQQLQQQVE